MTATRASGTNAVRYGTMRENVMALEVVLPDGQVIRTGTKARKSSAGYDLTHLFVGSEGTLGLITRITVRLFGQPEAIMAATCAFESVDGAVDAVMDAMQVGLPMARIEFLDEVQMQGMNIYNPDMSLPERPHLFLEFHGSESGVAEQVEIFTAIAEAHGGSGLEWARRTEDRNRLWKARHDAYYAAKALRPGCEGYVTDCCVPINRLATAIRRARAEIDRSGLVAPILGHVGDGNFHPSPRGGRDRPADGARACRNAESDGDRAWWHHDRRAWHRDRQEEIHAGRAWRRLRADGGHQEGHRPAEHHESRQDGECELTRPGCDRRGRW